MSYLQTGPVAPSNSAGDTVKSWERAWSITELKTDTSRWNLANDAGVSVWGVWVYCVASVCGVRGVVCVG